MACEEVLEVAHKYDIPLFHKACEEHLIRTLDNGNLPSRLAKKFEATGLEEAASQYFKTHFDNLISDVLAELC